ncbi:hypothetical protein [Laspinema olomoucense]|nr:hypothetical protein [Laspinema sp. D3b]
MNASGLKDAIATRGFPRSDQRYTRPLSIPSFKPGVRWLTEDSLIQTWGARTIWASFIQAGSAAQRSYAAGYRHR